MKNQRNREPVGSLFLFSYNKEEEIGKANVKEYKKQAFLFELENVSFVQNDLE